MSKTYVFPKNNTGLSTKYTRSADFCADRIDVITNVVVITNFAVITIVVIRGLTVPALIKGMLNI